MQENQFESVAKAFSKQSSHFDDDEKSNFILGDMRAQVRAHVLQFLKPENRMLELNAGTGLDAVFFSVHCKDILATDISDGMIDEMTRKIERGGMSNVRCQMLSFTDLKLLQGEQFDYVFSNFGGLNCADDLKPIAASLSELLAPGAFITLVIMPPFCFWETMNVFKGNFKLAFRRWKKGGTRSHLEGEFFQTYYFSPKKVLKAFGEKFSPVKLEGLGVFIPQPHQQQFPVKHPKVYAALKGLDHLLRSVFPFKVWGDHFIITMKKRKE